MAIYTAFVDEGEAFNPVTHSREDLTVFHARKKQEEGDVAEFDLEVLNTRSAWPGRRIMISEDGILLFVGYLVSNVGQIGETVTVQAVAKPTDALVRQAALCQSLKVAPFYDELALPVEMRDSISEVLAGHSKVLDWDPITGDVAAVDLFESEKEILIDEPFEGSVSSSFIEPPSAIRVSATARWSQTVVQVHNLSHYSDGLRTMTAEGLVSSWPKVGDELSPGMIVIESMARETVGPFGAPEREEVEVVFAKSENDFNLDPYFDDLDQTAESAFISTLETEMIVEHVYDVRRAEETVFELSRPLQRGLVLGGTEDLEITLQELKPEEGPLIPDWAPSTFYEKDAFIEWNGRVWKSKMDHTSDDEFLQALWMKSGLPAWMSVRRLRSFWLSDRGQSFLDYALERAKARMRHTGRCVRVSCDAAVPDDASTVRTDTVAEIQAPRLIGGYARGKIVDYVIEWADGDRFMTVTIAAAPGSGAVDALTLTEVATHIPNEYGAVNVSIENAANDQVAEFITPRRPAEPKLANEDDVAPSRFTTEGGGSEQAGASGRISPTSIKYSPVIPNIDLAGTAKFKIAGEFGLPNGYTVQ